MKLFKFILSFLVISSFSACLNESNEKRNTPQPSLEFKEINLKEASLLVDNPLKCIDQKYPYKTSVVYNADEDVVPPNEIHPSFYGCFDWHSAVHGHWSLVVLLKNFPDLPEAEEIKTKLIKNLSRSNIEKEVEFFTSDNNTSFERTYGWAWLLQLATELKTWKNPLAKDLLNNLKPLLELLEKQSLEFLPKLTQPIRVGEHSNTAFALNLMLDYAQVVQHKELEDLIKKSALNFFQNDKNCPINWEPSGFDFLSPCLEEARLMSKVLDKKDFMVWINDFLPQLADDDFYLAYAKVSDRKDGKLVHLDGLNFSRAWNFYELSQNFEELKHLSDLGDFHFIKTYPNLFGDSYEGSHWLGSFALYALEIRK